MGNYFWLVVLPNLDCFLGGIGMIGLAACFISFFLYLVRMEAAYNKEMRDEAWRFAKTMFKVFALTMAIFFVTCFIPSKKDIIQLKIISIVSELNGVEKIPQNILDRLNSILEFKTDND